MSFVCQQCHRTWPDKDNQIDPDTHARHGNDGICPDCAEDDEDDHPFRGGSGGGQQYTPTETAPLGEMHVEDVDTTAIGALEMALRGRQV